MNLDGIYLVEIAGGGCAGCEALMPEAVAAAKTLNLKFKRIDAENCGKLIERWQIEKLPALVLADGEKAICKCYGFQPQEILEIYLQDKLDNYTGEER